MNLCLLAAWVDKYQRGEQKIWKKIVDAKYRTSNPNILSCPESNAYSPFWKGVLWAAKAAKMGYQWKVGNGRKAKFWEDHWFGSCSLSIQFWELYSIANEHNKTIAEVWDGTNLKISFRRCVDNRLLHLWFDLPSIAQSVILNDDDDAIIWKLEHNGRYSVRSLYAMINFRGITPMHIPKVWQLHVPPNIHIFLWLLAQDKLIVRRNLSKRQHLDDLSCLFCCERETSDHLFFDCVVAVEVWKNIH